MRRLLALLFLYGVFALGTASASQIGISWVINYAADVHLYRDGTWYTDSSGLGRATATIIDNTGLYPSLKAGQTFDTYCVDLLHTVAWNDSVTVPGVNYMSSWTQSNIGPHSSALYPGSWPWPANPNAGKEASWLYNTYAAQAHGNSAMEAGLQLAIWEALYGVPTGNPMQDLTSTSSLIYFTNYSGWGPPLDQAGGPLSYAAQFLGAMEDPSSPWRNSNAIWLVTDNSGDTLNSGKQDFIAPAFNNPEPASILQLSGGLIVMALFLKKRILPGRTKQ
jgi:hypothetical protein